MNEVVRYNKAYGTRLLSLDWLYLINMIVTYLTGSWYELYMEVFEGLTWTDLNSSRS